MLQPELADSSAKYNARVNRHAVIIFTMTTMSLRTMSVIHFERIPVLGTSMSDQPQDVQAILRRIDVLERQNRWLVRAGGTSHQPAYGGHHTAAGVSQWRRFATPLSACSRERDSGTMSLWRT